MPDQAPPGGIVNMTPWEQRDLALREVANTQFVAALKALAEAHMASVPWSNAALARHFIAARLAGGGDPDYVLDEAERFVERFQDVFPE